MKLGTIGTGAILNMILDSVKDTEGVSCEAIYSRNECNGNALATEFHVKKVYTVLEEMLRDEAIDFIYVASPNSLHFEHARQALMQGKHVICEKPFCSTLEEARELATIAKEKQLFLFEAITTAFLPHYEIIKSELFKIGKPKLVLCNFSQYSSRYDTLLKGDIPNVFNPEFSGGALMDINLYNIHFVMGLFGKPDNAVYYPNIYKNGIDTSGIMIMQYPGFTCECAGAKDTWGMNSVQIQGEKGYINVKGESSKCQELEIVTKENIEKHNKQEGHHQWYFEIQKLQKIVAANDFTECYKRLEETIEVVEIIETTRKAAGILFAADKKRD